MHRGPFGLVPEGCAMSASLCSSSPVPAFMRTGAVIVSGGASPGKRMERTYCTWTPESAGGAGNRAVITVDRGDSAGSGRFSGPVAQLEIGDADGDVDAGLPLDAHRLQRKRIVGATDQRIGVAADPDGGA